jgi:dTDP-4-amino-4,6-dideoxygalactose transaminase
VSERLLRLPLFTNMSPEELDDVVDAVTSFEAAES